MKATDIGHLDSATVDKPCRFLFTVFTPTFNRAHTLNRVYESLRSQTFKNFEWLVIDDGSTDDTRQQVEKWSREGRMAIRYECQSHEGKHTAYNRALDLAQGELFLPLDSDDACVPQALERFKHHWDEIPPQIRSEFSGVCGLCLDQHGKVVGDRFPRDVFDSDSLEIFFRYRIKGEKWGFHRTDILRHFRFPDIVEANYIPESVVWFATARNYKERYVNEALRIYWTEPAGSTDQLTARFVASRHAPGRHFYYKTVLNEYADWLPRAWLEFARIAANYARMSFHLRNGPRHQAGDIRPCASKLLWAAMLPVGLVLYWKDKNASQS